MQVQVGEIQVRLEKLFHTFYCQLRRDVVVLEQRHCFEFFEAFLVKVALDVLVPKTRSRLECSQVFLWPYSLFVGGLLDRRFFEVSRDEVDEQESRTSGR